MVVRAEGEDGQGRLAVDHGLEHVMHRAVAATGDEQLSAAAEPLADLLGAVQLRRDLHDLDVRGRRGRAKLVELAHRQLRAGVTVQEKGASDWQFRLYTWRLNTPSM